MFFFHLCNWAKENIIKIKFHNLDSKFSFLSILKTKSSPTILGLAFGDPLPAEFRITFSFISISLSLFLNCFINIPNSSLVGFSDNFISTLFLPDLSAKGFGFFYFSFIYFSIYSEFCCRKLFSSRFFGKDRMKAIYSFPIFLCSSYVLASGLFYTTSP